MPLALIQIHFRQMRFHLNPDQRNAKTSKQTGEVNSGKKLSFARQPATSPPVPA
jgi:hypothetical protein